MDFKLPQLYFSKIMRAIIEFNLLDDGDNVLIGLSGGKDSILLAYALATMQKRLKIKFSLGAFTVNPMFEAEFDLPRLHRFCRDLGIPYQTENVDINAIITEQNGKSPCYSCAFFRRGAVNRFAKEHGYNKVAYAHHHDDAVETFLLNLLYSGQVATFAPKTYLDKSGVTVIRPLIYLREAETRDAVKFHGVEPVKSPCPYDGQTKREEVKKLLAGLTKDNPLIYEHLAAAMRQNALGELWPASKTRAELRAEYLAFMHGNKT